MKPPVKGDLSENERKLLDSVLNKNNINEIKQLLQEKDVRVDCLDENGSTPLQHAAFKGNVDTCKLLLSHGANVNSNEHDHGYTPLMFAALSGNGELCKLFLQHGAKTDRRNKVGRTASEMAAFTGQHHCVSTINNYLDPEEIEYYSKPHGSETEARIPSTFVPILHKLTLTYNVHPVKIILFICQNIELCQNEKKVLYILDDLMEKQMRCKETNEIMAFKVHMILSSFRACFKYLNSMKDEEDSTKRDKEKLLTYAKSLLATSKEENFPKNLELFMRQAIKEFPFRQSILFQQMIATLSKTKVGNHPTAVNCVHQILIGQRMMEDESFCATCGESKAAKRCSSCKMVNYCNAECQKLHWFAHKRFCAELAEQFKRQQAECELARQINNNENDQSKNENDQPKSEADQSKTDHDIVSNVENEQTGMTTSKLENINIKDDGEN